MIVIVLHGEADWLECYGFMHTTAVNCSSRLLFLCCTVLMTASCIDVQCVLSVCVFGKDNCI